MKAKYQMPVVGTRYGQLIIVRDVPKEDAKRWVEALCDCGNTTVVRLGSLRDGSTSSCGCGRQKRISVIGNRHGQLTIVEDAPDNKHGQRHVVVLCDCGVTKTMALNNLRAGKLVSCGCYREQKLKEGITKTHGYSHHPLYGVWSMMRQRCTNPNNQDYPGYGGRGITVCQEWTDSSEIFIEWALANGWEEGLKIDRRENNDNYCPDNCHFVTDAVNSRNKRSNLVFEINGEQLILADAVIKYSDQLYETVLHRLKLGWNIQDALTAPRYALRGQASK